MSRPVRVALVAALLAAVWFVLSGRTEAFYLGIGAATALFIALTIPDTGRTRRLRPGRFLLYLPWLVFQIVSSNLRVARMVLSRRMPVRPTFVRRPPGVRGDRALAMLGASITLTPGTLTVDVDEDEIVVHALDDQSRDEVREGLIAQRVAGLFEEPKP